VPHDVSSTSANLWIGAIDEELPLDQVRLAAQLPQAPQQANSGQWPPASSRPRVRYGETLLRGLAPRQTYRLPLTAGGRAVAEAKVTTLPEGLPVAASKPFTVFLGSCFSRLEDSEGRAARAYAQIPLSDRPDIKILAGDQVYLDSPYQYFFASHPLAELSSKFVDHYKETWGNGAALRALLEDGANFFCSDDHEFWNNAPNVAPHLVDTLPLIGKRDEWWKAALELYTAFQGGRALQQFSVPPVSFLIVDTRINRSARQTEFMRPADLAAVERWVRSLTGPGILVIGQPLLRLESSFLGHFKDWNLPDYRQYKTLTRAIGKCRHSLIILTGDVHYGRIAVGALRSGAELIEIISSPMSLVDKAAKGKWEEAPPQSAPSAMAPGGVQTERHFSPNDTHFLTLELTKRGTGAHLRVRYWPIVGGAGVPADFGAPIWERTLR